MAGLRGSALRGALRKVLILRLNCPDDFEAFVGTCGDRLARLERQPLRDERPEVLACYVDEPEAIHRPCKRPTRRLGFGPARPGPCRLVRCFFVRFGFFVLVGASALAHHFAPCLKGGSDCGPGGAANGCSLGRAGEIDA